MKLLIGLVAAFLTTNLSAQTQSASPAPIQVMVLGTYHFGNPGLAELNAAWYQRNVKIFAKLVQATRPDDRVIVMFGAGHAFSPALRPKHARISTHRSANYLR